MKSWVWALRLVGAALAVIGSVIWGARNEYSPENALRRQLAAPLVTVDASTVTDLTAACNAVNQDEGWVLFVVNARLVSDARVHRHLQTADEPFGLFIEYDPPLLRLGLGLGAEKWNTELPIRYVRRDESAVITVGVSRSQTRVVTNLADQQTVWPNGFAPQWRCDGVELGRADHTFASGATCQDCAVSLRYTTGAGITELNDLLDSLSNSRRHNTMRIAGTGLTLFGFVLLMTPMRLMNRRRSVSDTSPSIDAV
jgi:hypothetical protein